jgi:hypothetical protein
MERPLRLFLPPPVNSVNWFNVCFCHLAPILAPTESRTLALSSDQPVPRLAVLVEPAGGGADGSEAPSRPFRLNPTPTAAVLRRPLWLWRDYPAISAISAIEGPEMKLLVCGAARSARAAPGGEDRQRLAQNQNPALRLSGLAKAMSCRFRKALCAAKSLLHPRSLLQPTVVAHGELCFGVQM